MHERLPYKGNRVIQNQKSKFVCEDRFFNIRLYKSFSFLFVVQPASKVSLASSIIACIISK